MIEIGKINKLIVEGAGSEGFTLRDADSDAQVFMPRALLSPTFGAGSLKTNEEIEAFVYLDSNNQRMLASPQAPVAVVGEFAHLRVVEVQEFGAFLDWGIAKDLLVPGNEQKIKLRAGDWALVRICLEQGTNRVYGTTKLGKHIEGSQFDVEENDKVNLVPVEETELGYRCIINKKFIGMIYHNEIFSPVKIGKTYPAFVKKVREDGLVDAAMQVQGVRNLFESKTKVLEIIKENGGKVSLTDKSPPEQIQALFGMSKKSFKSAVGMLYKERLISIKKDGIELTRK
ncbi:MAG: S1-like domain-containing RNA-binding protein [Bacteriovoracaceae bacterium]